MITLGLKNYFKSYRFFFVPLGALSLGIVAGLSIMVPMSINAIKEFITGVAKMMGEMSFDWDAVKRTLLLSLQSLDWAHPQAVVQEVFSKEYLGDLLRRAAEAALGDTSSVAAQFETLVGETVGKVATSLAVGVFLAALGGLLGYFVTRSLIRHDVAKRSVFKALLNSIVKTVLNVTVIAFGVWLISKTQQYAALAFLLTVALYGAVSFFEAYLVHGYKKIPLKKVMSVKNLFEIPILTLIEFVIAAIVYTGISLLTNELVSMYVSFAIFVITIICVQLNAEAYVKSLVESENKNAIDKKAFEAAYAALAREHKKNDAHISKAVAKEEETVVEAVVEALTEGPEPVVEKEGTGAEQADAEDQRARE
ncbi:MAG: hypothetical protein J5774_02045 [Clostridia bacterium]|nr:hypothetical protein [Clostridia bacterium]